MAGVFLLFSIAIDFIYLCAPMFADHRDRNHQGLENRLIISVGIQEGTDGAVRRRERLGGMNYYHRQAA